MYRLRHLLRTVVLVTRELLLVRHIVVRGLLHASLGAAEDHWAGRLDLFRRLLVGDGLELVLDLVFDLGLDLILDLFAG